MKPDLSRAQWRKSSYSGNTGNCVEVADLGAFVAVRDTKNPDGPVLVFSAQEWREVTSRYKRTRLTLTFHVITA